jgi:hypothetical protein
MKLKGIKLITRFLPIRSGAACARSQIRRLTQRIDRNASKVEEINEAIRIGGQAHECLSVAQQIRYVYGPFPLLAARSDWNTASLFRSGAAKFCALLKFTNTSATVAIKYRTHRIKIDREVMDVALFI